MYAHRIQKFGQATKAAQLLEIKQPRPVRATFEPGPALSGRGLCSNTAVHPPLQLPSWQKVATTHLQTLRREAFTEHHGHWGIAPHPPPVLQSMLCIFKGAWGKFLINEAPHNLLIRELRWHPLKSNGTSSAYEEKRLPSYEQIKTHIQCNQNRPHIG